jgi:hypothetical protein
MWSLQPSLRQAVQLGDDVAYDTGRHDAGRWHDRDVLAARAVPDDMVAFAAVGAVETEPEKVLALLDPDNVCDEAGSGC